MTRHDPDPLFDQRVSDWLEADPDHAPGIVLDTVVAAFPSIPQRRSWRPSRRFPAMITPARAAVAAVIGVVAIGGAFLVAQPRSSQGVGSPDASPSNPPSIGPSPSPGGSPSAGPSLPLAGAIVGQVEVSGVNRWIAADADTIWLPQPDAGSVAAVDIASTRLVGTIAVGASGDTESVAAGPSGAFATRLVAGGVSRLDVHQTEPIEAIETPDFHPYGLALDGDQLWMTDFDAGAVGVLDLTTRAFTRVDGVKNGGTTGIAVGGGIVWVAENGKADLLRIDASTHEVLGTTPLPDRPMSVVYGFGSAWVGTRTDVVVRVDADGSIRGQTRVPGQVADGLAVGPDAIWATSGPLTLSCESRPDLNFLSRIDPASGEEVARLEVPCAWAAVVVDGDVWVLGSALYRVDTTP